MEAIFHEKQEGSLCAQHCLNALLQGQYFSAVDLADIARQLDEQERQEMAVAGVDSEEYRRFIQQPSHNFDDSGFFSIQVISKAVSVWGVDLVVYNSSDAIAVAARACPVGQIAYICNFREHWLAIRRLGNQWFNLNSLLSGPELLSDTYLAMFLTQLQQEGYSIFIAVGSLPECEADELLKLLPAVQPIKPRLINEVTSESRGSGSNMDVTDEDEELRRALAESKQLLDRDDAALQRALQMSMEGYVVEPDEPKAGPSLVQRASDENTTEDDDKQTAVGEGRTLNGSKPDQSSGSETPVTKEEIRQRRLAFLNKIENTSETNNSASQLTDSPSTCQVKNSSMENKEVQSPVCCETSKQQADAETGELSEQQLLQRAIDMSMEGNPEG